MTREEYMRLGEVHLGGQSSALSEIVCTDTFACGYWGHKLIPEETVWDVMLSQKCE